MTDGTSQGLFIVVAIVIFGIFVVLAYILFEDTLSPAMANMFTTATEQATTKLESGKYYHINGVTPNQESDFIFENGKIIAYVGTGKDVIIPYKIDGQTVTTIGESAFMSKSLTSVIIPNTVKVISRFAFNNNNLKELHIPDSVVTMGYEVFESNKLEKVYIGKGLTIIPAETFRSNNLESIVIPPNIREIGSLAFTLNKFKTFTIPKTVTLLGERFLGGSLTGGNIQSLVEIRVPEELRTSIGNNPTILGKYGLINDLMDDTQKNEVYDTSIVAYY